MGTVQSQWCTHYTVPYLSICCTQVLGLCPVQWDLCLPRTPGMVCGVSEWHQISHGEWICMFLQFPVLLSKITLCCCWLSFEFNHVVCISNLAGDTSANSVPASLDPCLPPRVQPTYKFFSILENLMHMYEGYEYLELDQLCTSWEWDPICRPF